MHGEVGRLRVSSFDLLLNSFSFECSHATLPLTSLPLSGHGAAQRLVLFTDSSRYGSNGPAGIEPQEESDSQDGIVDSGAPWISARRKR